MNEPIKFKVSHAEATKIAEKYKGLKINGVDDKDGYKAVYDAQQDLKGLRGDITRYGKKAREEALAFQREVLAQEKDLLKIIVPIEDDLKSERDRIDEEKKQQERLILLPSRRKMLDELERTGLTDKFILDMDEKEFAEFYNDSKADYLANKEEKLKLEQEKMDREKREIEQAKIREAELEKVRVEAAKKAKIEEKEKAERAKILAAKKAKDDLERVEREKQEAIAKIKREQAEKERKAKIEVERLELEEKERVEALRLEQEKAEKNKKYTAWLKKNGFTEEARKNREMHIIRVGNTFELYKKIDEITI